MRSLPTLFCASVLALCGANHLSAQIITENPNELDSGIQSDGSGNYNLIDTGPAAYQARIGELYAPGGEDYVMPFQLPTLTAGEVITTTSLQLQLFTLVGSPSNADLYAIGTATTPLVSSSATVLPSEYYQGPLDTSNTLLQANFLTPASTVRTDPNNGPFITTSLTADASLAAFLNIAENGGANAGDYVFLRISYDASTIPAGNNAYAVLTDDAGGSTEKPILSITEGAPVEAPEPTTWMLLTGGLAFLLGWVRRPARS